MNLVNILYPFSPHIKIAYSSKSFKKVKVSNDKEMAQSEQKSRWGKNKLTINLGTDTENRVMRSYFQIGGHSI